MGNFDMHDYLRRVRDLLCQGVPPATCRRCLPCGRCDAPSPENDAEGNLEGELCMLLDHLWNAAGVSASDHQSHAPALRNTQGERNGD